MLYIENLSVVEGNLVALAYTIPKSGLVVRIVSLTPDELTLEFSDGEIVACQRCDPQLRES